MKSAHIINAVISYRQAMRAKGITCAHAPETFCKPCGPMVLYNIFLKVL